jgi:integrase
MRQRGHIRRRSKHSWEIKLDCGRDATGKRIIHYHSVKGTEQDAKKKLTALLKSQDDGAYVAPTKETVANFVRTRVTHWEASGHISGRTAQRYRQLVENQIVPHLGTKQLRDLRPRDIENWHTSLRETVEPRTVGHAHRVLSKALKDAVANEELVKNVAKTKTAPKVTDDEMVIVKDVPGLVAKLPPGPIYVPAMIALFTGTRLGEILALRWGRVDIEGKKLAVEEAVEETGQGLRFKLPKSRAGRRTITLPDILVGVLREYRREQLEARLGLVLASYLMMPCCSQTSTADLSARQRPASGGRGVPKTLGCPTSPSTLCATPTPPSLLMPGLTSSRSVSDLGTPNPTSPCGSTAICSATTTARRRRLLTRCRG